MAHPTPDPSPKPNIIIQFSHIAKDPRDHSKKTYWFAIRLQGYEFTNLSVGFDQNVKWVSATGEFFELDPDVKAYALAETKPMAEKWIKGSEGSVV